MSLAWYFMQNWLADFAYHIDISWWVFVLAGLASLEAKFPDMVRAHAPAAFERVGQNFEENQKRGDRYALKLLPLKTLHLGAEDLNSRLTTLGSARQINIFGIVGALILLLACVNFMNLTTARSMQRAREVGVRKVLGSRRSALIGQFLTEAMLFSVVALVFAGILVSLALPFFNLLTGLEMTFTSLLAPKSMALVAGLTVLIGLVGGTYPALYLSKFNANEVLKSAAGSLKGGHAGVRSGMVVFQFSVSLALMLCSWVVFRQLEFSKNQSPGLQRKNVLIIENTRNLGEASKREAFRQQLLQMPGVLGATHSTFLPSMGSFGDFYEPEQGNQNQRFQVIAVVRDFHLSSVRSLIEPTAIFHQSSKTYQTWGTYFALQLRPGTEQSVIEKTGKLWTAAAPASPFGYDFLDASFARLYRSEAKMSSVLGVFTGLALFIGCLGLFALAAFTAEQRTKEIGIRKVLGASVAGITGLLARDFLKLVVLAIFIASPLAWYFMQNWLADFAYRIDIEWWFFAAAGFAALLIAFLTVGFQSVKAALADPVESLRSE